MQSTPPFLRLARRLPHVAGTRGLVIGSQLPGGMPPSRSHSPGQGEVVIQIWMWGGPPHLDTFDPKPAAGYDYCGPFEKPIATNVAGIQINELLPLLAKQADKYSHYPQHDARIFAHETASYAVQTGRMPGERRCIRASARWFRCSRATTPDTRA